MAYYAALATLLELLEDIIHYDRYPDLLVGRQTIMESLYQKVSFLEELLQDYSSKGNEATDRLERRIKDAANRAQDIIELEITKQIKKPLHRFSSDPDTHLKKVGEEIDAVVKELVMIKERLRYEKLQSNYDYHDTSAFEEAPSGKNTMVGFDAYLTTIKDQLCGQSSQHQVVSIVGTGGIGKTTLARNIFDDGLIIYYFDCRAWVVVSQEYNVIKVLHNLLKSLGLKVDESSRGEESVLKEQIHKYLKGRRYLIIIDDIWNIEVWNDLSHIFPNDCNGSRILLTTRLLDIAQYPTTFVHQIECLNKEDSWKLFQERVFANDCCPPELEVIGKLIASKCYGLPLAIVVIGGMLSNVRLLHKWKETARNMSTILSGSDDHLSNILSLSYNHLPHQLKACVLHMSSFPNHFEISVAHLIRLWIAEGFLRSSNKSKNLEEVGEECLKNLVRRNLVMIIEKTASGKFKFCVLHDLLRNFCRHKAFDQDFLVYDHKDVFSYPGRIENARRFVYVDDCFHSYPCNPSKLVRSFVWFFNSTYMFWKFYEKKWERCELLRILDMHGETIDSFPDAISRMFHLRYLYVPLGNSEIAIHLPSSIWALQNLQILVVDPTVIADIVLPPEIWKMARLRQIVTCVVILPPVSTIGDDIPCQKLECLHTLETVFAFVFTDEALEMIPNLRKLKITYRRDWPYFIWEFYCLHNLFRLHQLEYLKINLTENGPPLYVECCLNDFVFPPNLRNLSLHGCGLPWKYMTVVSSLPKLEVLKLKNAFHGLEWEPIEGEFCCLKFLLLDSLDLKFWRANNTHFPCLEHLKIRRCNELEIPAEVGDIPTLKIIDVFKSEHAAYSAMQIKEEQQDLGNDTLEVRIVTR